MTKIPMYFNAGRWRQHNAVRSTYPTTHEEWRKEMAEMLTAYLNGEDIYVEITGDAKRVGSIGKIKFDNVQQMLGNNRYGYWHSNNATMVKEDASNVDATHFNNAIPNGKVRWDGRTNRKTCYGSEMSWLKGYQGETNWVFEKVEPPKVVPQDKLGRDIKIGDFISYILYHFAGNKGNAAGIYYGKVTKIENDGTVHAKNIKLQDGDHSEEKRIKDNSLIVIMTKDLMDKLMMARLSVL